MTENISEEPREGGIEPELTRQEYILAQVEIGKLSNLKTIEERNALMTENSEPFRELVKDSEVRELIRGGDFEEVARRLEVFKKRRKKE